MERLFEVKDLHALYREGIGALYPYTEEGEEKIDEIFLTECSSGCCCERASYRLFSRRPNLGVSGVGGLEFHADTDPETMIAKVYNAPFGYALGIAERIAEFYDGKVEVLLTGWDKISERDLPRLIRITRHDTKQSSLESIN